MREKNRGAKTSKEKDTKLSFFAIFIVGSQLKYRYLLLDTCFLSFFFLFSLFHFSFSSSFFHSWYKFFRLFLEISIKSTTYIFEINTFCCCYFPNYSFYLCEIINTSLKTLFQLIILIILIYINISYIFAYISIVLAENKFSNNILSLNEILFKWLNFNNLHVRYAHHWVLLTIFASPI